MMKLKIKKIRVEDQLAIISNFRSELFIINPLGLQIIEYIDDGCSEDVIVKKLFEQYEVPLNYLEKDVKNFISLLIENNLLI